MPSTLLIGIGNVLRGDDGVGCRLAERLGEASLPGEVRVVAAHQLLPEHVDLLRELDRVIVVDAAVDVPAGQVAVTELATAGCEGPGLQAPGPGPLVFHHLTPAALLAACATLHGRAPRATLVRIGVASTEASTELSPEIEARFDGYCRVVRDLLSRQGPGISGP
jgi:hydrogenase maturation protease